MTTESILTDYTARLREFIRAEANGFAHPNFTCRESNRAALSSLDHHESDEKFRELALELFTLQFQRNEPYRRFCLARAATPETVGDWTQIPAIPTAAFKEVDLTSLPLPGRTVVFHSSGTTGQRPSRHFHDTESLAVYEASLLPWFNAHVLPDGNTCRLRLCCLVPSPARAPHSSLVHMFETVRRALGAPESVFVGGVDVGGVWTLDATAAARALEQATDSKVPILVLGTAFSFVHLLERLGELNRCFRSTPGSRAMETGGYKGRARAMSRGELHGLTAERLGIVTNNIVCEYGMSELSSQAYDTVVTLADAGHREARCRERIFRFPPWARVRIISPETGEGVGDGETGLIRVFDLANVRSVMAIQTEDLGIRRRDGFELIGRAAQAEPRGCSLMAGEAPPQSWENHRPDATAQLRSVSSVCASPTDFLSTQTRATESDANR